MISILRPLTPPAALISSAASCAACGIEEPATAWASAMTAIFIGSLDCPQAGPASARASMAALENRANFGADRRRLVDLIIVTTSLERLLSSRRDEALSAVYLMFFARQVSLGRRRTASQD